MSTQEVLEAYDAFASKMFSKANKNKFNITERYGALALEQTVQQLVEDQSKGRPLMRDSRPNHAKGRAFVCTMPLQDRNTTVRLGTGSCKAELVQARAAKEIGKQIVSLLKVMKEFTTDTRRHHEQMELKFKDFPGMYFRFDVEGCIWSETPSQFHLSPSS